jgi:hypothetical protein
MVSTVLFALYRNVILLHPDKELFYKIPPPPKWHESTSKFRNVVLENEEDQLDQGGEEYRTYNKEKKG